ncbi:hypothetical protein A1O3_04344, partial [Capronia epimyces CBS 606.96]
AMGFLDLPLEIRLGIYAMVFGHGKAMVEANTEDDSPCLLPRDSIFRNHSQRSAQLLRVNRTLLLEARPVLYANTIFHVLTHSSAGKLPRRISDGHPCAPFVKRLIWQLDCDILSSFDPEDVRLDLVEAIGWISLDIRCRADTWRNSFLGEWCDREAFVRGRDQVITYAHTWQKAMGRSNSAQVAMIEDRSQLGQGQVRLSLDRTSSVLEQK